jgi:hypothetical protein
MIFQRGTLVCLLDSVELKIELKEGAEPVSKPVYRLSPSEQNELKSQIELLWRKDYYDRVLVRGENQCCLLRRRMEACGCAWTIVHRTS